MNAHPLRTLTIWFCIWKLLLLLIIIVSPGPGYDTSTELLLLSEEKHGGGGPEGFSAISIFKLLPLIVQKLARWDSIYFLTIAERGYEFEHQWAFGYGYAGLLPTLLPESLWSIQNLALVGVALSHFCHYLSVLVLYKLTSNVFSGRKDEANSLPILSAALHIICPAGVFLSAACGEATFSFLNFLGFYVYACALNDDFRSHTVPRDVKLLAAGSIFAVSTTVRSNGVLSGILFACDAVIGLKEILLNGFTWNTLHRLFIVCISGSLIILGIAGPQFVAYTKYCLSEASPRPWCGRLVPSIYTWVQSHYWNVGFLKYWKIPNLPLFCLAAPMLFILLSSSLWAVNWSREPMTSKRKKTVESDGRDIDNMKDEHTQACLTRLALTQAAIAIMAITNYHVQIITRVSSGYPLWYWYLSSCLLAEGNNKGMQPGWLSSRIALRGIVLYGIVQASLFASFLPPA